MKISKILYGFLALAGITLASCENEYPKFDDSEAFVAFTSATTSVGEAGKTVEIPVLLTSLSGIETEVSYTIDTENSTAVEGTHFTVEGEKKLKFTKDAPTQKIVLNVIDNDSFDGDVHVSINLVAGNVKLGASKTCKVTIEDDEHPLLLILGTFTAKGESYFNGETEWTMTISKDADDLSKVWISNLVPDGSGLAVYGVVNDEKTEIHVPVGQDIVSPSSSYPHTLLEGFYGPDGDEDIPTGGYITIKIAEDGTLSTDDYFGSHVYSDDACTASAGWYNLMASIISAKKQ